MSSQSITLTDSTGKQIRVRTETGGFVITLPREGGETNAYMTQGHARMLMLYLREHVEGQS